MSNLNAQPDASPAEVLRAAATLLLDTASKATAAGGPTPWRALDGFNGAGDVATPGDHVVATTMHGRGRPVAEWIALMSPAVAEPLAALLAGAADDLGGAEAYLARTAPGEVFDPFEYVDEPDSVRAALAFARSILGGRS
jgi:hypothetical protein